MLSNAEVSRARPKAAPYKLTDERGLHLFVTPGGRKSWRWRFRWGGKEQLLTIGEWPEISLDDARERASIARDQLGRGEDPRADAGARAEEAKVRAFEYVCRRWHALMLPRWTPVHAADVLASLERDIIPALGAMPIEAITTPIVLNVLRSVEQRGTLETARRLSQRISAVFVFAISEGLVQQDPAAIVGKVLMPPAPPRHQPALLDIDDARELLARVDQLAAAPAFKQASRFLALTGVRLACVRGARWSEIEDLDGPAPLWRVPAARMKLKAAKKTDAKNDHLVPLAPAAAELLRTIRTSSGGSGLVFPGRDGASPIGEAAIGALYDRAGYRGRHVPHGWRATFSTIMNESGRFDRAVIDQALGHAQAGMSKVEAAYNRAEMLDQRRALFTAWAELLG